MVLADRRSDLLVHDLTKLRDAVAEVRARRPFGIDAFVVLPDHLHCLWTLPHGDADFSTRWKEIKANFTKSVGRVGQRSASKLAKGKPGFGNDGSGTIISVTKRTLRPMCAIAGATR